MSEPTNKDEARAAVRSGSAKLRKQLSVWERVWERARSLSELGEENHFSERIANTFRSKS